MSKRALVVAVSVTALLALAAPAHGQPYPPAPLFTTVSDSTVVRGQVIDITAGTFMAGTNVTFTFTSEPVTLGSDAADADGVAAISAAIPADARLGSHTISASGTGTDGSPLTLSTTVTVVSAEAAAAEAVAGARPVTVSGALPRTGDSSLPLARVGAALLAVGGGLVFITRRRRAAATT